MYTLRVGVSRDSERLLPRLTLTALGSADGHTATSVGVAGATLGVTEAGGLSEHLHKMSLAESENENKGRLTF